MRAAIRHAEFLASDDPNCVWVNLGVGPVGEDGSELFDIFVCTPEWLAGDIERNGPRSGWATLVVPRIDADEVLSEIESQFARLSADSWSELATRLSRIAIWEFDGYADRAP